MPFDTMSRRGTLSGFALGMASCCVALAIGNAKAADVYRYMNFDQIQEFQEAAESVTV